MKPRKCKVCRNEYTPARPMQPVCASMECRITYANKAAAKSKAARDAKSRADTRAQKERIKRRSDWMREAQQAVNTWVRLRDRGLPCISCGRHHQGQNHAGHYLSRGAHPELALEPMNIFLQCAPCNVHLSGNQIEMRKGIIERYGIWRVQWLEGPHEPRKYSVEDLKAIKTKYNKLAKELKNNER